MTEETQQTEQTQQQNGINCFECDSMMILNDNFEGIRYVNGFLCRSCHDNYYLECNFCENLEHEDNITQCEGCESSYCDEHIYYRDNCDNYLCSSCNENYERENNDNNDDNDETNNNFDTVQLLFKKIKSNSFKQNKFKNYCGIELECYNKNHNKNKFTHEELNNFQFSQISDGSLNNSGVEFVSNAFNGDLLFNKIDNFTKEVNKKRFYVDDSCGFHLHIGITKNLEYIRKICIFYQKYENFIFNMLPKSRQNNRYCKKLNDTYYLNENKTYNKLNDLKKDIYGTQSERNLRYYQRDKYNAKRYCWLNLHSLFYRGTLEFRNHSATLNNEKIKNWVKIHLTILDFLKNVNLSTILKLPINEGFFLSLFDEDLKKYIVKRYQKFYTNEINTTGLKILN